MRDKYKSSIKNVKLADFRDRPFKFWLFVAQEKKWAGFAAALCIIVAATISSSVYLIIKRITNSVSEYGNDAVVVPYLIVFVVAFAIIGILYRLSGFLAAYWITNMEMFASRVAFDYVIKHSTGYFSERLSGKLQNRIFNISRSMDAITGIILWNFLTLSVKIIVFFIITFATNILIGVVAVITVVMILIYSIAVSPIMMRYATVYIGKLSTAKGLLVDVIGNILATKQNVALGRESKMAKKALMEYQKEHLRTWRLHDVIMLGNNFFVTIIMSAVLWTAVYLWQGGMITVGDVLMLLTMLVALYGNLEALSGNINRLMEQVGKLKEGLEDIFVPHEVVDKENVKKVKIERGGIVFDKVSFNYRDNKKQTIFKDLNLVIPAGQKVGVVGESGAGKSTFVSLLLRFMDVDGGSIKIDEHNISEIRQDDLRQSIAYVPQDALLFHRTIGENIKYSDSNAGKRDIILAAKRAHALDFINKFPKGFKTLVGERGVKLSGGQKQRVMIARAMLKKSPILVLDEATSALDSRAEKLIQEALENLMKGRTTIAIAHRLSTLKQMDRIIVFEDGMIVEDGTHEELIANKGQYYKLWRHQS